MATQNGNSVSTTTINDTSCYNSINGDAEIIYSNDGGDTINGYEGNDYIYGGNGSDSMTGGTGNDVFVLERPTAYVSQEITNVQNQQCQPDATTNSVY